MGGLREMCDLLSVTGDVGAGRHCSHSYLCLGGTVGFGFRTLLRSLSQLLLGLSTFLPCHPVWVILRNIDSTFSSPGTDTSTRLTATCSLPLPTASLNLQSLHPLWALAADWPLSSAVCDSWSCLGPEQLAAIRLLKALAGQLHPWHLPVADSMYWFTGTLSALSALSLALCPAHAFSLSPWPGWLNATSLLLNFLVCVCVCQRTPFRSQFSSSIMCILGFKLPLSYLVAVTFAC